MGPVRMGLAVDMGGLSESGHSPPAWWFEADMSSRGFPPWSSREALLTWGAFSCCWSEKNLWVDWSTSARCLAWKQQKHNEYIKLTKSIHINHQTPTFRSCSAFRAACEPRGTSGGPVGPLGGCWMCWRCCCRGWGIRPPLTFGDIGGPIGDRWTPPAKELVWVGRTRGETMLGWDRIWTERNKKENKRLKSC